MRYLLLLMLTAGATFLHTHHICVASKNKKGSHVTSATVSLIKSEGSSAIKLAVPKESGADSFLGIKEEFMRYW